MEGIAHGMKPKGKGPSKAVAEEFVQADKGKQFSGHPGRLEKLRGTR